jgi:hypothetical protein
VVLLAGRSRFLVREYTAGLPVRAALFSRIQLAGWDGQMEVWMTDVHNAGFGYLDWAGMPRSRCLCCCFALLGGL